MSRRYRFLVAVCLAGLVAGCALMLRQAPRQIIPGAFRMQGVYARAGAVALKDHLEREQREALAYEVYKLKSKSDPDAGILVDAADAGSSGEEGGHETTAREDCFSRPEAYDVEVRFDGSRQHYEVAIVPMPEVCLGDQGFALIGGGAKYLIDARTFGIIERSPME